MPRAIIPLPVELGPAFTAGAARSSGVHVRRLRHADVTRIAHGLYARSSALAPDTGSAHPDELWRIRQVEASRAVAPLLSERLFFTGATAAAIWGLPVRATGSADLEVSTFHPHRAPRRTGLRATQVKRELVRVVEHCGLRVIDPASTWAVLGGRLALPDCVALGDAVIRQPRYPGTARLKRPPLAAPDDLGHMVTRGRRAGIARLRDALPLLSPHSASPPESHLRLLIGEWRLPAPALDFDVRDAHGRLLGCSELAFPAFRLAVEYEGRGHMTDAQQWNRDIEKYRDYTAADWETLRVTAELLYGRRRELRSQLIEALTRRGWAG
ncbi:MAG: hypothetical protein KDB25_09570 [Leucobacter sp.]|nr:hypothetical protein [Leucobacter sp.]